MSLITVGERCQYCSQFHSKFRTISMAKGNVRMCDNCYHRHVEALKRFALTPPPGCQTCGTTFDELKARALAAGQGNLRMVVVWKDGIYQVQCGTCSDAYLPKRVDLFKGTPFGSETLNL